MRDMYEVMTAKAWDRGRAYGAARIASGYPLVECVLSGEFADSPTPNDVLRSLGINPETADDFLIEDVCDTWVEGYYSNDEYPHPNETGWTGL